MKERVYAIDLLKFIAVLFITNSHFVDLYKDVNPSLATLGVHGNALFFFASGFTLALGKIEGFINWYKKRIARIWPTFIVWSVISNLIWMRNISWSSIVLAKGYWFIQCILYSYILLYFLLKRSNRCISYSFILSICLTIVVVCFSEKTSLSIYHSFHWICYISSMILGLYCGRNKPVIRKCGLIYILISFILYFVIMSWGKGKTSFIYYTQLLAIIPLHSFLYYFFGWSNSWMNTISKKWYYKPVYYIGSLCLEIYVVQSMFFTDRYNSLFPMNIIIVFIEILVAAYMLRMCTNFFTQTLSSNPYNWKSIVKI